MTAAEARLDKIAAAQKARPKKVKAKKTARKTTPAKAAGG